MKRRDSIKLFEKNSWYFLRESGRHDVYTNGEKSEPRHRQINEQLAKTFIKKHVLK